MDQLRQMLATVRMYLGKLGPAHKLLMASLVVIMVMTLAFVSLYSSKPSMVAILKGYPAEDQQRAAAFLLTAGVKSEIRSDGVLWVAAEQEGAARAALAENGKLPGDKTLLFTNLFEKQSWINSRQQNEQMFLIALQNQLAQDVSNFKGIRSATVILDIPETQGIGRAVRQPSASATVTTQGGGGLSQSMVDAIAGYIAGSRAGLEIDRVRVIDASTGQQRKASNENDTIPTTAMEAAAKVEETTRQKLGNLLSYIPGVIVAVTAQVDVTRVNSETTRTLPKGNGSEVFVKSTNEDTTTTAKGGDGGGEAGLRSNVEADVGVASSKNSEKSDKIKSDTEFVVSPGSKRETVFDPRGMTTMVGVSVNVPRGFVAALLKPKGDKADAKEAGGPDDAAVQSKFDAEVRPQIEALIRPHVRVMTAKANSTLSDADLDALVKQALSVAMIPAEMMGVAPAQQAGILGTLAGGAAGGGIFSGGLIDKVVLGALAVVALGMMFMMVKKAGKKSEMPTAEELVGLPPQLETGSDLIGEADEGDAALAGIEVDEKQVQVQQVLEQVTKMVDEKTDVSAKLLNRWIQTQE